MSAPCAPTAGLIPAPTLPAPAVSATGAAAEPPDDADPTYTHFAHGAEFAALLARFLAVDVGGVPGPGEAEGETALVTQMGDILDYYLPMPGLLDPALDDIVPPLMHVLGTQLARLSEGGPPPNAARLARIGRLVNWVVKVRGWKAVVPYFPSTLPHLHVLITLLSPPAASGSRAPDTLHHPAIASDDAWELRAVLLLWLALLLTVPFSLSALSEGTTVTHLDVPTHERLFAAPTSDLAVRVTLLALPLLHRPGREGGYAALVLARLFARDDAVRGLPGFLAWAAAELAEGEREREANLVAALLAFLSLLPGMIAPAHLPLLQAFFDDTLIPHLAGGNTAASSGLIRKLAVKARGRWWLARLHRGYRDDPDAELPDGIEEVLDDLMSALGDKDTIVRYSAAKYLARISALLPADLADQIVAATIGLYAGTDDEPVLETKFGTVVDPGGSAAGRGAMGLGGLESTRGEARWHGVCLAVAELARRGLLSADAVADAVPWVVKALTFDLRRASHSIGSNVRDAAAYVLWSLSRAASPETIAPFADRMATTLVCVAVFDREVGVRRAASAAFQEGVGRLGIYPAGIDVLAKTDFYSVSVRRKAFTNSAPAVAEHAVYRAALRDHLHHITLRHWDAAMRSAGAAALAALLALDTSAIPDSIERELAHIPSLDPLSAHGALLALAAIAPLVDDSARASILASLVRIRPAALVTANAPEIIAAGCNLTAAAVTPTADLSPVTRFFEAATRRREADVHEALAAACRRISEVRPADSRAYVARAIADLNSARQAQRQANALSLGQFQYAAGDAERPVTALLGLLEPAAKADVETRRNAVRSLADIACQRPAGGFPLSTPTLHRVLAAMTRALDDYTTDQRGDVGSWIRTAAVRALGRVVAAIAPLPDTTTLVPQAAFDATVAGIAKQAFEKLEVLREAATEAWGVLLSAGAETVWSWPGADAMAAPSGAIGCITRPSAEWFSSGLALLRTPSRPAIVAGLLQSAGSAVNSTAERALGPLTRALAEDNLRTVVVGDVNALLAANLGSNRIAVPALTLLARLLSSEADAASEEQSTGAAPSDADKAKTGTRSLALATRGVATLKSIDRIGAAMRVVVAGLRLPYLRVRAVDAIGAFLGHRFPRIRSMTAEALYLALSDDDIDPDLEDALLETSWTDEAAAEAAEHVVELLKAQMEAE